MNKQQRKIKGITKQKRRLKIWSMNGRINPNNGVIHDLKTMSTPCSCSMCSPRKMEKFKPLIKQKEKVVKSECNQIVADYIDYFGYNLGR